MNECIYIYVLRNVGSLLLANMIRNYISPHLKLLFSNESLDFFWGGGIFFIKYQKD